MTTAPPTPEPTDAEELEARIRDTGPTVAVRLTQAELQTLARHRFGDDPLDYAFACPSCGDVATLREFRDAGDGSRAGQECIGRLTGALTRSGATNTRGCDWAAYGLFRGPWLITLTREDGTTVEAPGFALAPAPAVTA